MLDLRADRYSQLGSVAAAAIAALVADRPLSAEQALGARQLAASGILTKDESGRRIAGSGLSIPTVSALEQSRVEIDHHPSVVCCGLAVVAAKVRLKMLGLHRTITTAQNWKTERKPNVFEHRAVSLAQSFVQRRVAIPTPRACLPDSLALFGLLMSRAIDVTLVIGVRTRPFAAHCWVQTDQTILSDAAAPIRELTPIMTV